MNADVVEARVRFVEAERTPNLKLKSELYIQASKLYLKAVPFVADDSLKRSLIYLSSTCVVKASNCVPTRETTTNEAIGRDEEVAISLNSERVLQVAHLTHLQKTKNVPLRIEANAVQVVRDMLDLETALANIGFVNPVLNKPTPSPSEQLMRSTFAFNSDLGESFMVLDTKGKHHNANAPMHSHIKGVATSGTQRAQSAQREATNEVSRSGHPSHSRPASHRVDRHMHPPSRDSRAEARHLQNTRSEIENELNNPLVQSYLSTHAPAAMAQSHFDFDNLTQSTISTFNKDTIDNAEGVLNLLQTVRRIGDENAQLLLKIEMLSHLEERSAKVCRDIDRFKEDFEEKLECVRDMLEEFVEASAAVVASAALPQTAVDTSSRATNPTTASKPPLPLQALNGIIHQELESRRAAVVARKAAAEAEEHAAREKAAARGVPSGGSAAGRSGMGIAEQHHSTAAHSAPVGRQQQLEKMVKALVARQEKSNAEIKKKNELLDKYVRIINQFQKEHPTAKLTALDSSTMSVGSSEGDVHVPMPVRRTSSRSAFTEPTIHSAPSMETVEEGDPNAESEGADGSETAVEARDSELKLDLAAAAVAASGTGGVVSTFRKPAPTPAPSGAGGIMSPPRGSGSVQQGMPSPPGSVVRTSSGGSTGSSALRKSSLATLPPRSKHHSTTTLEVLQKNAKL